MRAIKVSDRVYRILKYGSEVYGESIGKFLERLIEGFISKYEGNRLKLLLESEIRQKLPSEFSVITEGLNLIREFDSEKARELEIKLKELRNGEF